MIETGPEWMSDKTIIQRTGEKIRRWRLDMNMSQQTLANLSRLSLSTVSALEAGKGITLAKLVRILRVLRKLDALTEFLKEEPMSPILYEKIMESMKERKRASKNKKDDQFVEGVPVWNTHGNTPPWE